MPRSFSLTWFLVAVALAGCGLPRDPEGTLDRVRGDMLRVGVTEAPPFVVRRGAAGIPGGVEAALVQAFADSLGAVVAWHWGPAEAHFEALKRYELDLVAAGLTAATPWKAHVGLTRPYHTAHEARGRARGREPGRRLRTVEHTLAVPPGENGFLHALEGFLEPRRRAVEAALVREAVP